MFGIFYFFFSLEDYTSVSFRRWPESTLRFWDQTGQSLFWESSHSVGLMSHGHPAHQQEHITHESYPRLPCTSPLHKHWLICLIHSPANARGGTHDTARQPLLDSPQNPAGLMVLLPALGKVLFQKAASKASRKDPQDGKVVSEGDPMWWKNSTMVFTLTQSMPCGINEGIVQFITKIVVFF